MFFWTTSCWQISGKKFFRQQVCRFLGANCCAIYSSGEFQRHLYEEAPSLIFVGAHTFVFRLDLIFRFFAQPSHPAFGKHVVCLSVADWGWQIQKRQLCRLVSCGDNMERTMVDASDSCNFLGSKRSQQITVDGNNLGILWNCRPTCMSTKKCGDDEPWHEKPHVWIKRLANNHIIIVENMYLQNRSMRILYMTCHVGDVSTCNQFKDQKQLDDGWPESVEEQSLLLLVWRHVLKMYYRQTRRIVSRQYITNTRP